MEKDELQELGEAIRIRREKLAALLDRLYRSRAQ